jgi:solute:Na+ symporter, SSS family
VTVGRLTTLAFVLIGCFIAPSLGNPRFGGIFTYIQEFQGYISPGILAAFVFGLLIKKAPDAAGVAALILTVPIYGFLQWQFSSVAFLNRMALTFAIVIIIMIVITGLSPRRAEKTLPVRESFDMTPSPSVKRLGILVVGITIALYIIFW